MGCLSDPNQWNYTVLDRPLRQRRCGDPHNRAISSRGFSRCSARRWVASLLVNQIYCIHAPFVDSRREPLGEEVVSRRPCLTLSLSQLLGGAAHSQRSARRGRAIIVTNTLDGRGLALWTSRCMDVLIGDILSPRWWWAARFGPVATSVNILTWWRGTVHLASHIHPFTTFSSIQTAWLTRLAFLVNVYVVVVQSWTGGTESRRTYIRLSHRSMQHLTREVGYGVLLICISS